MGMKARKRNWLSVAEVSEALDKAIEGVDTSRVEIRVGDGREKGAIKPIPYINVSIGFITPFGGREGAFWPTRDDLKQVIQEAADYIKELQQLREQQWAILHKQDEAKKNSTEYQRILELGSKTRAFGIEPGFSADNELTDVCLFSTAGTGTVLPLKHAVAMLEGLAKSMGTL